MHDTASPSPLNHGGAVAASEPSSLDIRGAGFDPSSAAAASSIALASIPQLQESGRGESDCGSPGPVVDAERARGSQVMRTKENADRHTWSDSGSASANTSHGATMSGDVAGAGPSIDVAGAPNLAFFTDTTPIVGDAPAAAPAFDLDSPLTSVASFSPSPSPEPVVQQSSDTCTGKRPRLRSPRFEAVDVPQILSAPPTGFAASSNDLKPNYRLWTSEEDAHLHYLREQLETTGMSTSVSSQSFEAIGNLIGRSTTAVGIRYYSLKRKAKQAARASTASEPGEVTDTPHGERGKTRERPARQSTAVAGGRRRETAGGLASRFSPIEVKRKRSRPSSSPPSGRGSPSKTAPAPAPTASATSTPSNRSAPRRYTDEEDLRLEQLHHAGLSAAQIGVELGRSTNSVYNRLTALESMGRNVSAKTRRVKKGLAATKQGQASKEM